MMNLIYIHTHDSGTLTGAYGYGPESSEIKKFAEDSLLFRNAFTVSPTCSPSRSALLTGKYPHENGMLGLANRGFSLNTYDDHLVNILKNHGYHTVLCGIQHEAGRYTDHKLGAQIIGYDENISAEFDMSSEEKLSEWDKLNTKSTLEWLKNYKQEEPLFLSFGLFSTHRPFPIVESKIVNENYISVPQFLTDNEETREDYSDYLESLAIADECFGKILQGIKDAGMYDNSIILFTTDHGIAMPFSKCNLTDQGLGVSFIMRDPRMNNKGKVTESLISQVDLLPTIFDLLDIKENRELSGKSFSNLFVNEKEEIREDIFAEINFHTSYEPMRAVRTKRYKYIRYFDDEYNGMNLSNIDTSKTKDFYLDHDLAKRIKAKEYLFDLIYDPTERNSLVTSNEHQEVLKEMRHRLYDYMEQTNDPLLKGKIIIKDEWKVNKPTSTVASSKDPNDYL